ncbi:uncharacterized protein DSM5745_03575 [Aspergillus mulundensis]|uniref:Uncharacterized protein n=1 Tax=Aspergillus mulundensis TaxID=1810919 RepID=A0A3D8SKV2_9EURO|nr:hypothetical protein DSM5745_03575 [Aspergillus mulundensis]RDW86933.1 hypothetical protein DSM5745_03575 [Aspergillus mulundensis]
MNTIKYLSGILQAETTAPGPLELWIAMTDRKNQPEHWALILRHPGSETCTRLHMENGYPPSSYTHLFEDNKQFDSWGLPIKEKIATISRSDEQEILNAASAVPPQRCQRYVVSVLARLETTGKCLVPQGTARRYEEMVQMGVFEGPVMSVTDETWEEMVEDLGHYQAARALLAIQGWLRPLKDSGKDGKADGGEVCKGGSGK